MDQHFVLVIDLAISVHAVRLQAAPRRLHPQQQQPPVAPAQVLDAIDGYFPLSLIMFCGVLGLPPNIITSEHSHGDPSLALKCHDHKFSTLLAEGVTD